MRASSYIMYTCKTKKYNAALSHTCKHTIFNFYLLERCAQKYLIQYFKEAKIIGAYAPATYILPIIYISTLECNRMRNCGWMCIVVRRAKPQRDTERELHVLQHGLQGVEAVLFY